MINGFVWNMCRPRIGVSHLNKPASMGGFGLPDLKGYYMAAQLRPIYSFLKTKESTGWIQI